MPTAARMPDGPQSESSKHRSRELAWRNTHMGTLRAFSGQWVALEGEEIVAHGSDPVGVVNEARRAGVALPYVFYVESPEVAGEEVIRVGL